MSSRGESDDDSIPELDDTFVDCGHLSTYRAMMKFEKPFILQDTRCFENNTSCQFGKAYFFWTFSDIRLQENA